MLIKQLSLFIENKPGSLYPICKVLQKNNINIRTLSLADTEQFGILRLLVKEWEKARDVLTEAGFIVKVTDVIALPVEDHPGGLAELLKIVDKYNISVEYMYAFISMVYCYQQFPEKYCPTFAKVPIMTPFGLTEGKKCVTICTTKKRSNSKGKIKIKSFVTEMK